MSQRDAFNEDHVNIIWVDRKRLLFISQMYTIWVMLKVSMYSPRMPLICEHQHDWPFSKNIPICLNVCIRKGSKYFGFTQR